MTDPIVDSAVMSTMFSAPSMAVQPRMSDAENQCEMAVPGVLLADVIDATWFSSEVKTPSADSTMESTATATNKMMNASTEATKLNFMTDHGSIRDSVSIAW